MRIDTWAQKNRRHLFSSFQKVLVVNFLFVNAITLSGLSINMTNGHDSENPPCFSLVLNVIVRQNTEEKNWLNKYEKHFSPHIIPKNEK